MKIPSPSWFLGTIAFLAVVGLSFQNCAPAKLNASDAASADILDPQGGGGVPGPSSLAVGTIDLSPMDFGVIAPGSKSTVIMRTFVNYSSTDLVIVGNPIVTATGSGTLISEFVYHYHTNCLSTRVVTPGASCYVGVYFSPTTAGAKSATITINSTAVNSPHSFTVKGN